MTDKRFFDNVRPNKSIFGMTSGRNSEGNLNGTLSYEDYFKIFDEIESINQMSVRYLIENDTLEVGQNKAGEFCRKTDIYFYDLEECVGIAKNVVIEDNLFVNTIKKENEFDPGDLSWFTVKKRRKIEKLLKKYSKKGDR